LLRRRFLPVGLSGAESSNIGACRIGCGSLPSDDSGSRRTPVNISISAEVETGLLALSGRSSFRHLAASKVNIVAISGLQRGGTGNTLDILLLAVFCLALTWLTAR